MIKQINSVLLKDVSVDKGAYGISASAVEHDDNLYNYLRITDISDDGIINKNGLMSVDDVKASKYLLKENDIVFARTGNSTGRSYFYDKNDGELVYAGYLIKFSLDENKINPKYMKYYTLSEDYHNWINSICTGSTRKNINAKIYGDMPIILPSRKQQDFLVSFLSKLDKKIEINKKINHNLEEQIKSLFKSWFLNFDIFEENELIDSEFGKIPKIWKIVSLGDVTCRIKDKVGAKHYKVLSAINTGHLQLSEEYFSKQVFSKNIEKYLIVKENEFAYNPARINIGSIGINDLGFTGCVSPVYVVFKSEEKYEHFMNMFVKTKIFKREVELRAYGSVRQTLNWDDFSLIRLVYPSIEFIEKYNEVYESYHNIIKHNNKEIEKLTKLRDILLPKLMSGEIDVSNIKI